MTLILNSLSQNVFLLYVCMCVYIYILEDMRGIQKVREFFLLRSHNKIFTPIFQNI